MKTISLLSIIVCTAALAACSSDTDGNTSGGGGEGGGLTTANPSTNSVTSGTGGEGGGTDGAGGTGGTGDSSSSTGDTSSSSSGGDEDCSTAATPEACVQCEAQKNQAGAQKFVSGLGAHCLCADETPCVDTCKGTAACAAGGTDATACETCLKGLQADPANPDQCIKDFLAECQPDTDCKDFVIAQNACQSDAP